MAPLKNPDPDLPDEEPQAAIPTFDTFDGITNAAEKAQKLAAQKWKNDLLQKKEVALMSTWIAKRTQLAEDMFSLSSLIHGQCSPALLSALKNHPDYTKCADDCAWLLTQIAANMQRHESVTDPYTSFWHIYKILGNMRQQPDHSNDTWLRIAQDNMQLALQHGLFSSALNLVDPDRASITDADAKRKKCNEKLLAWLIIENSDAKRYKLLKETYAQQHAANASPYPDTPTDAILCLNQWETAHPRSQPTTNNNNTGNRSARPNNNNNRDNSNRNTDTTDADANNRRPASFTQSNTLSHSILLDTGSSDHVFVIPHF